MDLFDKMASEVFEVFEKESQKYTPEEMAEKCAEEIINDPEVRRPLLTDKYFNLFDLAFDKLSALLIEKGILAKVEWVKLESECEAEAQAKFDKKLSEIKAETKAKLQKKLEEIKAKMDKWSGKS